MAKAFWDIFVERYANDSFMWFQPKGFTISPRNLSPIQKKLRALRRFDGKIWREVQKAYADALVREKLFVPRAAQRSSTDYAAITRMNKKVFDSLGLVWVGEDSLIQITETGHRFLKARVRELPSVVESQLHRYMFPNPAVGRADPVQDCSRTPYCWQYWCISQKVFLSSATTSSSAACVARRTYAGLLITFKPTCG